MILERKLPCGCTADFAPKETGGQLEQAHYKASSPGVWFYAGMAWTTPQFQRHEINKAADILLSGFDLSSLSEAELEHLFLIINNWRSSHSFPLNTFQIGLRQRAKQVDRKYTVAQRLKRLSSISLKLQRFRAMKLSQMQDIAGCRAIVTSVSEVDQLVKLYRRSDIKHKLVHEDNYVLMPRDSGYRSHHLIYSYYSDKKSRPYNGLKVEVQIRSALQHAWATAVETVGAFIHQALKSRQGEKDWLRFFALMGTALALRERTPIVPNTPKTRKKLKEELREYAQRLDVENHLHIYGTALQSPVFLRIAGADYFLLDLDSIAKRIEVTGYKRDELEEASTEYLAVERRIAGQSGRDAVLVSVDSLAALRRAYPNYFLDMSRFIQEVKQATG